VPGCGALRSPAGCALQLTPAPVPLGAQLQLQSMKNHQQQCDKEGYRLSCAAPF
jgi:hypothetical protein